MDFARDAVSGTVTTAAARWLMQSVPQERWLLLDPALVCKKQLSRIASSTTFVPSSALLGSALETFGELAPQMACVAAEADLPSFLERVVALDRTSPVMTLFKSSALPSRIREAFANLALVRVNDDFRLHCRFADARVLPSLLSVLTPLQLDGMSRCIHAWGWIDADGEFCSRDFEVVDASIDTSVAGGAFAGLELSAQQFAKMLDDSEPDTIFASLLDTVPELVPADNRGRFRALLADHLSSADALKVRQPADRLQFVVLALTCGPHFHRATVLQETWKAIRNTNASLKSIMSTWSDATWVEIDRVAQGATEPSLVSRSSQ